VGAAASPVASGGKPDAAAETKAIPTASPGSSAALDYLFNKKPQEGTAAKQASEVGARMDDRAKAADALGLGRISDPQIKARFETYLGMPEIPATQIRAYLTMRSNLVKLLQTNRTFDAWKELHGLAAYQAIDAAVSGELANRIEAIWNIGKTSARLDNANAALRQDIKSSNRNADVMSSQIRKEEINTRRREIESKQGGANNAGGNNSNNGGVPQAPAQGGSGPSSETATSALANASTLEGKLQLTEEYLTSLEGKARIKLNEFKAQQLVSQARTDFAQYIGTLFGSGRFDQVIIAADFYRKVFNEGEYPVEMANQVNASLEISRRVQTIVDVFRYKIGRNELAAATDRLQEAFVLSENHSAVLALERTHKERIAGYVAKLDNMLNLIESREFGILESLLGEIKTVALDFDVAKPRALVNAAKLQSQLRLGKAKLAAQTGDSKAAMEEFQAAAEAWPSNPALQDSAGTFFSTHDVKNQSTVEFDRLVQEHNYRGIFEKQLAFAPAIRGDPKREEALKAALLKIKEAEMASEKANVMVMNGDVSGAWETIEMAAKDMPDDQKLNKMRADLSGRTAEFVSALNKAKDAEARNDIGYSLSWYVNAQRAYPASRMANESIERLSKKILSETKSL
jgi:hypothetical protein